jgi:hypothetical protein
VTLSALVKMGQPPFSAPSGELAPLLGRYSALPVHFSLACKGTLARLPIRQVGRGRCVVLTSIVVIMERLEDNGMSWWIILAHWDLCCVMLWGRHLQGRRSAC